MTGVLGRPALARQDVAIGVRRTQRLGARWRRSSNPDGSAPEVFDFTGYSGELRITSNDGDEWLTKALEFDSTTGIVAAEITPEDTEGAAWLARSTGRWSLVATSPEGEVTVLVAGVMRIIQEGTL